MSDSEILNYVTTYVQNWTKCLILFLTKAVGVFILYI